MTSLLPPPLGNLIPAVFFLWMLLLHRAVFVGAFRTSLRGQPLVWGLAAAVPCAVALVLPASEYHFSGHEGIYSQLLRGTAPDPAELSEGRVGFFPVGIAWAMGRLLPGEFAESIWLFANRAGLGFLLVGCWEALRLLGRRSLGPGEHRFAGGAALASIVVLTSPPMIGWSATGFALVPALCLGLLSLLSSLGRRPALGALLGLFALGTRLETAPLVLCGLLLTSREDWRLALRDQSDRVSMALAALVALALVSSRAVLPLGPLTAAQSLPDLILANLKVYKLGGPLFLPLGGTAALALCGLHLLQGERGDALRVTMALWFSFVLALLGPLLLADFGARHLLPATLLAALLLGNSCGAGWTFSRRRPAVLVGAALAVLLSYGGVRGVSLLADRYVAGPGARVALAGEAPASLPDLTTTALREEGCFLVGPSGSPTLGDLSLDADSQRVEAEGLAQFARHQGRCVRWLVADAAEFSGDARAERLDCARSRLGLRPRGWLVIDADEGAGSSGGATLGETAPSRPLILGATSAD